MDEGDLEGLSPSAKLAYHVLTEESPCLMRDIVDESLLKERTAQRAVSELEEAGIVDSKPSTQDARANRYVLTDDAMENAKNE